MSLVVGEINYTNILPLFYYLNREKLSNLGCEFIPKVPSQLNEGMDKGEVQVGGISSFSFGEHWDEYLVLPDLSVSAQNEVGSIFLFSKVPITQLDERSIALTSSSATSVNLLKIILKKLYSLNNSYVTMEPNYEQMMASHDACLLIGDDAIRTARHLPSSIYCYDLGALWSHYTGLPMTFAVFAVRKEAWQENGKLLEELYDQFQNSKRKSIQNDFHEMIKSIQLNMGGATSFWNDYFSGLNYDLTDKHIEGLHLYYDLAYELGLLKEKVQEIKLWNPSGYCQSV
ncbi:menaquinone biosynthesis protein [Bacillus shivajii]|uniref:menaquinone biosynthetic enzyme MqnA/MqnD family protein n=1 Tax=Bacillus shivajii TaxID=1983719 RepID=UPI001CFA73FC|nr:menaquinone biosynthesis protein [Bacillus shivajii]UCZ54775.1 menaquinone biosynthesis protein [Bacillus shivajii]